ncbi:MAG: O-methyltransferase [Chloroflexota bacterium]|nr:O-methyltransferase [Chloroflexota bacterium]
MGDRWAAIDAYLEDRLMPPDPALTGALDGSARAGLPDIRVSPLQGKFLMLLARMCQATTILEIGTLGGYSTIWLARGLPEGGHLITLETDPSHAAVARESIGRAGLSVSVEVRVGPALETLPLLAAEGAGPFDLVFIDADKPNNSAYLRWAVALSHPGTVIVVDNVVRAGAVIDETTTDPSTMGVRAFLDDLSAHPSLDATALQTVGTKGHDGFVLAIVTGDAAETSTLTDPTTPCPPLR